MSSVHQVWPKPYCKVKVKGARRQSRQRERWEDNIRDWTGLEFPKSQRAVENRGKWRKLVVKSSVVPQRPSGLRARWWWSSSWFQTPLFQYHFCLLVLRETELQWDHTWTSLSLGVPASDLGVHLTCVGTRDVGLFLHSLGWSFTSDMSLYFFPCSSFVPELNLVWCAVHAVTCITKNSREYWWGSVCSCTAVNSLSMLCYLPWPFPSFWIRAVAIAVFWALSCPASQWRNNQL